MLFPLDRLTLLVITLDYTMMAQHGLLRNMEQKQTLQLSIELLLNWATHLYCKWTTLLLFIFVFESHILAFEFGGEFILQYLQEIV